MKKGALAAGAVALGTAGAGTAAAQDDGGSGMVVVFGDDYQPGVEYEIASTLDQGTKDEVFEAAELTDEFDTPDDWNLYLINYDMGGSAPSLGYLMSEEDFSSGDSDTMGEDGSFRNAQLNLIEATPGESGNGDTATESEDNGAGAGNESASGSGGGAGNESAGGN
ncbi:hypothetical protein HALLA_11340 [Halostagnicola larsenii XH-48]|uniref:Calcium-binding protein n=2 Tax=Halostagnicola larsenii TaxID=353800 RepID=W0JLB4_9EURY|nr:hypothetical protein HALLA_11340 [Halostagnicola larsenii XH-48]